jgi:hypothetical protein
MTHIPAFYYRRGLADDWAILEEGDGFVICRRRGVIAIDCRRPWKPEFEEAYRRHGATGVCINNFSQPAWEGRSLDFLFNLSCLQHLSLIIHFPMDVTPLGKLTGLESLALAWHVAQTPGTIDFTRLVGLKECEITWHSAFASILQVGSIEILIVIDAKGLKELDLAGLPRLVELDLRSCAALTRINFSERAKLIALELTNCHRLRPDWQRLAHDLRYLCLRDRIGFAIEEVVQAQDLRFLWAEPSNKHPTWVFLRDLPCLEGVSTIDIKIKKSIAELFRSINLANGHGPTLTGWPQSPYLAS